MKLQYLIERLTKLPRHLHVANAEVFIYDAATENFLPIGKITTTGDQVIIHPEGT